MQNIVMETHQGIITSRYSVLTTLNKVCGPLQLGINFKRLVGLKISLVKFTYPMGISGLGGGGKPSLPHYSLLMLLLISQWTKGLGVIRTTGGRGRWDNHVQFAHMKIFPKLTPFITSQFRRETFTRQIIL